MICMQYFVVALAAPAMLIALSRAANRRFSGHDHLPMQWSLGGQVVWTASRRVALAFTPALAAVLLIGTATLLCLGKVETQPDGLWALLIMALAFVGAHLLHLWLLGRSLSKKS